MISDGESFCIACLVTFIKIISTFFNIFIYVQALLGNPALLNYLKSKREIDDDQINQLKQLLPGAGPPDPAPPPTHQVGGLVFYHRQTKL